MINDETETISVEWAANENLTNGLTVDSMQLDTLDVITRVQESPIEYDLQIVVTFPLVNDLGQTSERTVVEAGYSAARIAEMNPGNMDFHDAWSVADLGAAVHPALDR